jgi:hypothetical protein
MTKKLTTTNFKTLNPSQLNNELTKDTLPKYNELKIPIVKSNQ